MGKEGFVDWKDGFVLDGVAHCEEMHSFIDHFGEEEIGLPLVVWFDFNFVVVGLVDNSSELKTNDF